ncbi:beta-ketoacyl-[acyl-carrier-protein] synthase II [Wohlfahrtiimonas chitiniclastica]|uniref:beta-ketoacyl-[acyl-carrier-protein] synthase family protein n=1 Tax=Wohlfahrtiimonas chitiniclastica TaxID=400946 RepID=UPI000B98D617|nr:beta-ketoacyl-[acyl-carrier-protein] synthase family protein [Wohlfahrtiimonas chitiniclastica]OYQ70619.1 beta-ketoacyl-[acyl-carrier-protein] synthase II [Wohlfahrtiimonas chitiniclastica]OYQ82098.1 beta-ketoacyl-[acyl-carrier-protein] synthase II [Wohlfahrtiimonas chitiniclastica]OYQ83824.1 beta-ketoacyl-[acyl-carrier-protein] synthase II [Wohlfahrtiimonas chitiniclastica]OYQ84663.1 beta-ketoacyl-[acyl-carrier-protein] synthase II [Wohlfahrtiimonas chitiniclastica]
MIYINALGLVNGLGMDNARIAHALKYGQSGLVRDECALLDHSPTYLGKITGTLPTIAPELMQHNSRNNQLTLAALMQIDTAVAALLAQYSTDRIGIIMGTSTSGIAEGERALAHHLATGEYDPDFHYQQQLFSDPSDFLAAHLGITGPCYTVSTACSSSAKAISSGAALIEAGMIDAAIVGGTDSLCQLSVNGFHALGALSMTRCTPLSQNRSGINIGEASGLMILSKTAAPLALLGYGHSSDAHHISAPHPEGQGAQVAMARALAHANLSPSEIGYINLHGTGTSLNDSAEAKAVHAIFHDQVPCSSTKHLTGHTLGAAGITELGLSALILQHNLPLPIQAFSPEHPRDDALMPINVVTTPQMITTPIILSNSFAFGGNNTSLIIGKTAHVSSH